jgi:hypothetical protein
MKTVVTILSLILLVGTCQCNGSSNPRNPMLGEYELVAHGNSGQLVFTGTISLLSLDQNHLKGQCIIKTQSAAPEGLFDENGGCEGLVEGKSISIDLAPSLDDAGLLLEGQFSENEISGTWKSDGFVTSEILGRFEAVKKN